MPATPAGNDPLDQFILRPELLTPDIISLEFLPLPETAVANATVDLSRFFTEDSAQVKRFRALERLIDRQLQAFQAEKGVKSVVTLGDMEKIRTWLNPNTLYLYDKNAPIVSLDWMPVDTHALVGELMRLCKETQTWIAPLRTRPLPGTWKNIIRLPFDIIKMQDSRTDRYNSFFGQAMHELIHHAEFERGLHQTENWAYTAYKERNATFWDYQFQAVSDIAQAEEILMDDARESEFFAALDRLLNAFLGMQQWEAGKAVAGIQNIKQERYQTWGPDHAQLHDLMGISMRSRAILEHYDSGVCGARLAVAARLIIWRLSFDAEAQKVRQQALQFTRLHAMSDQEAQEHMQMIDAQLHAKRLAFEKEFEATYYPPPLPGE
ncbi:hypothetical protein [Candidatus Chloroploca asiatica]|uniref:Uncharacterized protein n=1 Tax=Candidatus Chloroploca asiatica TaxID=1506545 RepID=A0A2H3KLT7_9CHLR|nr:hypothetical protein [Candidatus Chloroploca asiatica]PDV98992.1 hypothetical protein A9Q02_14175 [Candidatus Chloroploca asiatica]